jgi:hypothetical protein
MASSLTDTPSSSPDKRLVTVRPTMLKANNDPQHGLSAVVSDATKRSYGKQGAAAAQLGKDEGNFARDLRAGRLTLRDLDALGAPFLAALGRELLERYGELQDPKARARQVCDEVQALVNELRQFIEAA